LRILQHPISSQLHIEPLHLQFQLYSCLLPLP